MKKPQKEMYGFDGENWTLEGGKEAYETAVRYWEAYKEKYRKPNSGRARKTDVHPSWTPYLVHFNPSDPTRSQGAFARWLGVNPATVSGAKRKPISPNMAYDIERWAQSVGA